MSKPKLKLKKNQSTKVSTINLDVINPHSAGIDVGADEVYVSITTTANENVVKCFGTSTPDLREMADWLKKKQYYNRCYGVYGGILDASLLGSH